MTDPNASDWSDLDLLTLKEARARLSEEVAAVEAELAELMRGNEDRDTDAVRALSRRLTALRTRLAM